MNKRLMLAGLAATGGLLTTALLQVAIAAAAPGDDAFTIGSYTFDPQLAAGGEGFDPVAQLTTSPPLLELGGGVASLGGFTLPLASQNFDVYDPSTHADLGSITSNETVASLFGLTSTEFTVTGVTPVDGGSASDLPTMGSVYDAFNLGNGYENIYTAVPGGAVTDTFVTPSGDINLDSLFTFNAADPLNPGDAFTGLDASGISGAPEAFSIGGVTLDPLLTDQLLNAPSGGEGFDTVAPLATVAPLLELGGSSLGNPASAGGDLALQYFDVYGGSGSSATEIGNIDTGVDVTNLLGFTNTQLVVNAVTPADAADPSSSLPAVGTVYDAFNFGNRYENVYVATPGADGTVTDDLVTPYGNINLSSLFDTLNFTDPLSPGDAFTGLADSSVAPDAFSVGTTSFDPLINSGFGGAITGEGFNPVNQLVGVPPLLDLGGGTPTIPGLGTLELTSQFFNVYSGTGAGATEVGNIETTENVTSLLGLTNTEFTVTGTGTALAVGDSIDGIDSTPVADASLPTVGSVYDVFNFGGGFENVYEAIPGVSGGADTITDTLVTPLGDINLNSLFAGIDAVAALDPGAAFGSGLDVATSAATAVDPLSFLGL